MKKETLMKSLYLIAKSFDKFQAHEDDELIVMWFDVFKDEDDLLFQSAVKQLITTFEYPCPTIANLNHIIANLKITNKIDPGDVYDEIMNHIRYNGSNASVEGLSDIAKDVVKGMGGLKRIGLSESVDFDRTQMIKMSQRLIERSNEELLITNSMKEEQLESKQRLLELSGNIGKDV